MLKKPFTWITTIRVRSFKIRLYPLLILNMLILSGCIDFLHIWSSLFPNLGLCCLIRERGWRSTEWIGFHIGWLLLWLVLWFFHRIYWLNNFVEDIFSFHVRFSIHPQYIGLITSDFNVYLIVVIEFLIIFYLLFKRFFDVS